MKVKFTGSAEASVTYLGKYEVETGSVIEVDDNDANFLLQTGAFQAVEDEKQAAKDDAKKTGSEDSDSKKDSK